MIPDTCTCRAVGNMTFAFADSNPICTGLGNLIAAYYSQFRSV